MYPKYLNALFLFFSILFVVQGSCPLTISTPSQPKVCFVLISDVAFVYLYFLSVFVYLYLFSHDFTTISTEVAFARCWDFWKPLN